MAGENWEKAHFADTERMLSEMSRLGGLEKSFAMVYFSSSNRLDWSDDAAWDRFAHNLSLVAGTASSGGLKGILIDHEDYRKTGQFVWRPEDGDYDSVRDIARLRGRQIFKAIFDSFPNAMIMSYWVFSGAKYDLWSQDVASSCLARGDLWVEFLNGALDVLPETTRFIDGCESRSYRACVSHDGFRAAHWYATTGTLPLIKPENAAKYRIVNSVGMGQYLDPYINSFRSGCPWYFPPLGDSRLARCAENMFGAAAVSSECIWVYGEKGTWIDWDEKRCREMSFLQWEKQLPGLRKVVRAAVGDYSCLRHDAESGIARDIVANPECDASPGENIPDAFGTYVENNQKVTDAFKYDAKEGCTRPGSLKLLGRGLYTFGADGTIRPGQIVRLSVRAKGRLPAVNVVWRRNGAWDWERECHIVATESGTDSRAWKHMEGCYIAPEGVDGVGLTLGGVASESAPLWFDDVHLFIYPAFAK